MKIDPDLYQDEYTEKEPILRRIWRVITRTLLVIFLAILVGIGLYYGVTLLVDQVVDPVQENILAMQDLEDRVGALETSNEMSASQIRERLVSLEAELADQAETLAALQADLTAATNEIETISEQIASLEDMAGEVEDLSTVLAEMTGDLDQLDESVTSVAIPASALEDRSQMVLSMILLTRARMWLEQDNRGLAADDITAARDVLAHIEARSEAMADTLEEVLDRLDNALDDVRRYPQVAANELEIAWKLLVELAGPQAEEDTPTPTPTATP